MESIMEYLTHIATFIAGLGAGWTLKVVVSNMHIKYSKRNSSRQNNNTVGGDMAGGDIKKNR
jgi:hypothetical protein